MRKPGNMKNSRRQFLVRTSSAVAALGLPRFTLAAQGPEIVPVTAGMNMISGLGGNVLAWPSEGGMLLVDTGSGENTSVLRETLAGMDGGAAVHTVFNTHWHLDQVGGNDWFGANGATIIAHEKTRLHLSTPYYLFEEERYQHALAEAAWPTQTIHDKGELAIGGDVLEYGYLVMAHTDADITIRFRNANVIAVGDVVSPERDPGFDWFSGGWIGGRVDALNRLLEMSDTDTKFVPSYGSVIGRAHVEAERDLMQFLYDTLVDQIRMGFDWEDSLATGIMDNLPRKLDDPAKFLYDAHKGLWAHHNKLEPNIV